MAAVARPRPSNGETLHERSKGKDVRISNIVAAKVRPRFVAVFGWRRRSSRHPRTALGGHRAGPGGERSSGPGLGGLPDACGRWLPDRARRNSSCRLCGRLAIFPMLVLSLAAGTIGDPWGTARSGMFGAGFAISNCFPRNPNLTRLFLLPHQNIHTTGRGRRGPYVPRTPGHGQADAAPVR